MILQEGSFTIMDLTKAVKEKYKKSLASCTNEEIYICLLEQVKKLAKEKEAASEKTAATTGRLQVPDITDAASIIARILFDLFLIVASSFYSSHKHV